MLEMWTLLSKVRSSNEKKPSHTFITGIHKVEELLANQYFGAIGAEILYPSFPDCPAPLLPVSREYLSCYVRHLATTGDHITSTAPLGKSVDERLRFGFVHF